MADEMEYTTNNLHSQQMEDAIARLEGENERLKTERDLQLRHAQQTIDSMYAKITRLENRIEDQAGMIRETLRIMAAMAPSLPAPPPETEKPR